MRKGIITRIHTMMKENKNIYFLTGDLGFNTLEDIEKDYKERFINVGIAEQNMVGIASGLALSRKKVFVYSIIPFITMRCFEQIRDDICYNDLDVTLLGVGAGLSYGVLGSTHFALEDIAILRALPQMSIFSPADETEALLGLDFLENYHHPVYFRIGKKIEPVIYERPYNFRYTSGMVLQEGKDIVIFSTGPITKEVLKATDYLQSVFQISTTLVNIHTLKPIDEKLIVKVSRGKKAVFTVEEHSIIGGLGSAVSEVISAYKQFPQLKRIGTNDQFIRHIGSQDYLRKKIGLSSDGIVKTILSVVKKSSK